MSLNTSEKYIDLKGVLSILVLGPKFPTFRRVLKNCKIEENLILDSI
jgi:hypothetical protein